MNREPSYLEVRRNADMRSEKHRKLISMLATKLEALKQADANKDGPLFDKSLAEYKALETEMIFTDPGWPVSYEDQMLAAKAKELTHKYNAKTPGINPIPQKEIEEEIDLEVEERNNNLHKKKFDA